MLCWAASTASTGRSENDVSAARLAKCSTRSAWWSGKGCSQVMNGGEWVLARGVVLSRPIHGRLQPASHLIGDSGRLRLHESAESVGAVLTTQPTHLHA